MRRKENSNADKIPCRPELEELQKKFALHFDSNAAGMSELRERIEALAKLAQPDLAAPKSDPRIDSFVAKLVELQHRIETAPPPLEKAPDGDSFAARLAEWQQKIEAELAALKSDPRMHTFAAHLAALQQKIEAELAAPKSDSSVESFAAHLSELQQKIEAEVDALKSDTRVDTFASHLADLQQQIEAEIAAPKLDPRVDSVVARLGTLESATPWQRPLVAIQDQLTDLHQKVTEHDRKLSATSQIVLAIEQSLSTTMAEFDSRMEAQDRSLEAVHSSLSQTDELMERVLDLVQGLPPAEPHEPVTIASGAELRELQL